MKNTKWLGIKKNELLRFSFKLKNYWKQPFLDKNEIERQFSKHLERIGLYKRKFINLGSYKEALSFLESKNKPGVLDWDLMRKEAVNKAHNAAKKNFQKDGRTAWQVAVDEIEDPVLTLVHDHFPNRIEQYTRTAIWNVAREVSSRTVLKTPEEVKEFFKGYVKMYENGLFCFWVLPEVIVYVCNPKIFFKEDKLHNDSGPAILWENAEKYYFLNGIRVKQEIVETPAEQLNPELLVKEQNTEVRKEIIRKIGMNKILQKLNAEKLDSWREYELYRIKNIDIESVQILKMKCPTKDLIYSLRVPPGIKQARDAIKWVNNGVDAEEFVEET